MGNATPRPKSRWPRALERVGIELIKRTYAVGVIALTGWLSFMALRYLVVTLIYPSAAPARITGLPMRLDPTVLETHRRDWRGLDVGESPRTPPAHYHRIDAWIQPDQLNDCTRSGCHARLPHARRKEVRAFLNMHATSIHCGVCHMAEDRTPLPLAWYELDEGTLTETPAALRAYELVTSDAGRARLAQPTTAVQAELASLLLAAAKAAEDTGALRELARHVAAVRPTSAAFQEWVEATRTALPRYFRGEYGAKLALRDASGTRPVLGHPGTRDAVREYLRRGSTLVGAEREALLARVHPLRRSEARHCLECHRAAGGLLDFDSLGYPAARQAALTQPLIFQMIEHIADGQPMYLPGFIGPASLAAPAPDTQPAATQGER